MPIGRDSGFCGRLRPRDPSGGSWWSVTPSFAGRQRGPEWRARSALARSASLNATHADRKLRVGHAAGVNVPEGGVTRRRPQPARRRSARSHRHRNRPASSWSSGDSFDQESIVQQSGEQTAVPTDPGPTGRLPRGSAGPGVRLPCRASSSRSRWTVSPNQRL